ncbi:hypothetical protein OG874_05425 [Nocardia sp. NBC_00565]|uniref:hypothetical protein n=1 Tax=Nocardia sp. NBC_00565 TaxID=2975993 RepID=UPI002E7FD1A6|nr:hypothetical protein [Nocardia sp. NBC_00565]WUC04634.1 hypothetical protein OG874_05425 [Nocardia sp. NBC_00565]
MKVTTLLAVRAAVLALTGSAIAGVFGAAGSAHAEFGYWLLYNRGTGMCATTQDDPANGITGTARFAPCDANDRRQWFLRATTGPDTIAFSTYEVNSRGQHRCIQNAEGGWGLAFLAVCDNNNYRQSFNVEFVVRPDGTGSEIYRANLDNRRLSVPYAAGTSYVTIRNDFPNEDPRTQWDRLATN